MWGLMVGVGVGTAPTIMSIVDGVLLLEAGVAETACPSAGVGGIVGHWVDPHRIWNKDPFTDQLSHTVTMRDVVILVGVIEQDHSNIAPVIGIKNSGTNTDPLFNAEARPSSEPAITVLW